MPRSAADRQRDCRRRQRRNRYLVTAEISGLALEQAVTAGWIQDDELEDVEAVAGLIALVFEAAAARAAENVTA